MNLHTEIFKAYDIRGTYPEQINKEFAFLFGRAYLDFIKELSSKENPKIIIGRDTRPSSPEIFNGLVSGINREGGEVISVGQSSTPMLYFATNFLSGDGGLMITASHNPAGYNGLKVVREKAIPIGGESGFEQIKEKAVEFKNSNLEIKERLEFQKREIYSDYISFLTKDQKVNFGGKVVVDPGNGMQGLILKEVLNKLEVDYCPLYFEPDCTFPNHESNPLKEETLHDLKETMKEKGASLGIAFDGDGDRVAFVDEKRNTIGGDFITALLSKKRLEKKESGSIVYDLRSSKIVPEVIKENGGTPIKSRVGHSFIKVTMRENNSIFAGELSSHFYYPFEFNNGVAYFESSTRAMIEVLETLSKTEKNLSEIIAPFRKYFQSGEINFEVEDKEETIKRIAEEYPKGEISRLDGLTVEFDKWWFNLRPSNTEPLLRLNLEADTEQLMKEKIEEIKSLVQSN